MQAPFATFRSSSRRPLIINNSNGKEGMRATLQPRRRINDGAERFISKYHTSHITHIKCYRGQGSHACWICNVPVQNMDVRLSASFQLLYEQRRCTCTSCSTEHRIHAHVHVHSRAIQLRVPTPLSVRRSNSRLSPSLSPSSLSAQLPHFHPRIKLRPSTATL